MAETRALHRCSILIVDDDADVTELLRVALETEGYRVASAANGRDALDHLRSHAETTSPPRPGGKGSGDPPRITPGGRRPRAVARGASGA